MLLLTNKTIEKLKYDLVREKLVDYNELQLALEKSEKNSSSLAEELVLSGVIAEKDLLVFIENKLHIPSVELSDYEPDLNSLNYITLENAQKYNIFPLFKIEDVLTIAMADPLDLFTINELFEMSEISIEPVVASETSIKKAIDTYYKRNNLVEQTISWQDAIISDNLSDETLSKAINDIFEDAINHEISHICFERTPDGMNLFFEKRIIATIPNILVPRFVFELKNFSNLDTENEDVAENSKFLYQLKSLQYSIFASFFPAKFSQRISFLINKPLKNISEYGFDRKRLTELFKEPALIMIKDNDFSLWYSLAEFLSEKFSVLLVENLSKYELNKVSQIEVQKNIGINFDELIKQIELQNFEIIFFEKLYSVEQLEKLQLLAKEKTIVIGASSKELKAKADYMISSVGTIS